MTRRIRVGTVNELAAGQGKLVQIDGQRIALFNVNGTYHATDAVCPHEDGPLHEGVVDGETIICPWHGYDFHVKTGECLVDSELRVTTFDVTTEGNDLFIQVA